MNIYFYTIRPILPNQELLVWYCREFAQRLNYPLTGELMLQRIREQVQQTAPAEATPATTSATSTTSGTTATPAARRAESPPPAVSPPAPAAPVPSGPPGPASAGGTPPHKGQEGLHETLHEGSVRSDEGYHSNGYHDEVLTPPEDSSDSDSENYVLDFSKKHGLQQPSPQPAQLAQPAQRSNEFRKVKIKMTKAYHYKAREGRESREGDSGSDQPESPTGPQPAHSPSPSPSPRASPLSSTAVASSPVHVARSPVRPVSPVLVVAEERATSTTSPGKQPLDDDQPAPRQPSSILENILLRSRERDREQRELRDREYGWERDRQRELRDYERERERELREYEREREYREREAERALAAEAAAAGDQNNNGKEVVARHASSSPTEMAYSYKKSHRYGAVPCTPCSPDSSSSSAALPPLVHSLQVLRRSSQSPHTPPLSPQSLPSYSDLGYPTQSQALSPGPAPGPALGPGPSQGPYSPPYHYAAYGTTHPGLAGLGHGLGAPPHPGQQLTGLRPPSPAGSLSPDDGCSTR